MTIPFFINTFIANIYFYSYLHNLSLLSGFEPCNYHYTKLYKLSLLLLLLLLLLLFRSFTRYVVNVVCKLGIKSRPMALGV